MARRPFWDMIDGYEVPKDDGGEPLPLGERFFVREISGVMTSEMKRRSTTRFYKLLNSFSRIITYTRAKVYGAAALTFSSFSFIFGLLGYYLGFVSDIPTANLVSCAVFSLFGALLLFSEKPVPTMIQDNKFFDFIFFDFFCIQRVHRRTGEASINMAVGVVFGAILALASMFVSPIYFIVGILGILYITVAMGSPEFSYITSILLIPLINIIPGAEHLFLSIIILTAISFVRKVIYGKRVIFFEQYDLLIILLMFTVLISGIFIKGMDSFASSAVLCIMSLGYYLTSSMITNRRIADRVMNSVVVSAVPVSVVSIISYIVRSVSEGKFTSPSEPLLFGDTSVAAAFLLVAVSFSFAHMIQTHTLHKKLSYIASLIITLTALFLTGEVFAITALLLSVIAYFVFKLKKPLALIFALILFILPMGVYLIPAEILEKIFVFIPSVGSYGEYIQALTCSLKELSENLFLGIGIGAESFAEEMDGLGISARNSGNLFLELALEAGVLALIFFVSLLIARVRHRVKYYSQYIKGSVVKHSQPVVSAAVCALIFYGMFSYIWSDVAMFYLFFAVFAVESAMLRISRKARDERILYYEDAKSSESAAVDIELYANVD